MKTQHFCIQKYCWFKISIFVYKNTVCLSIDGIPPDLDSDLFLEIAELPATSSLETGLMECH